MQTSHFFARICSEWRDSLRLFEPNSAIETPKVCSLEFVNFCIFAKLTDVIDAINGAIHKLKLRTTNKRAFAENVAISKVK